VDSQSQSGYGELDGDDVDDDDDDVEDEEEHKGTMKVKPIKSMIDVAPSTLKVKKPTARRSTMYGLNQAAITMCNQAGGKLFPCLKGEVSVYRNGVISHVGIANIGNHPTYYGISRDHHTFVPPVEPTQEI
jgi:hypothetical protein